MIYTDDIELNNRHADWFKFTVEYRVKMRQPDNIEKWPKKYLADIKFRAITTDALPEDEHAPLIHIVLEPGSPEFNRAARKLKRSPEFQDALWWHYQGGPDNE